MIWNEVKTLIWTFLIIFVLINLPYLPGPNFLNTPAQIFLSVGQIVGMLGLLGVPFGITWTVINKTKNQNLFKPLLFLIIFLVPLISLFFITNQLQDFSRNIAINNGNKLVQQIDFFKRKNGYYPEYIDNSIFKIPHSCIIGIEHYDYRKTKNSFELVFFQNVLFGFNFEIVTYNNRNEQKADGEQQTLYKTNDENWKYEIFD